jgi:hypothetical protein
MRVELSAYVEADLDESIERVVHGSRKLVDLFPSQGHTGSA